MNETSEDGLNEVLSSFSSALEELAKDPDSEQTRAVVVQNGDYLCKYLNNAASNLISLKKDYNSNIKVKVNEINSYASQIRDLNEQIYKSELDGSSANDLRDQRDLLMDKLTCLADVRINEVDAGTLANGKDDIRLQITLDGVSLVNHFQVNGLECYTIDEGSEQDGMYGIRWMKTGNEVEFDSGEIKGYLDMRDGTGEKGGYKGIPYYMEQLDHFAGVFAKAFNEGIYADGTQYIQGHAGGADSDETTGIRFFTFDGKSSDELMKSGSDMNEIYQNVTAANITISSDIEDDPGKIAAASLSGEDGNNENINELVNMFNDSRMFADGMPVDYINSIVSTMGTSAAHASRLASNYESTLNQIDTGRISVSGVSLDEESANLVRYQQAYSAAAKMISVLDEILDITINGLGAG
jgi:flagellar hook-associated protein 1 FlgK